MRTWRGEATFAENVKAEPEIIALVPELEVDALCSLDTHLRYVDEKFAALGLD
jgi:hypothetical protein